MRIRAVLRDTEILQMKPGSDERIQATIQKNLDRIVNLRSLLKIMGLKFEDRSQILGLIEKMGLHVWLANEGDQHVIFMSRDKTPDEPDFVGYRWS